MTRASVGVVADWLNPCMKQTLDLLAKDVDVELIWPEKRALRLENVAVEHDLYVLKSGTEMALSLAGILHAQGAATLNPFPTVAAMRNKIIVTGALHAAGLPVPKTIVTSDHDELAAALDEGPLILKPFRGSRGEGIRIVHQPDELDELSFVQPFLAQRYMPPDGRDRKLYRIGDQIFGVKRVWPLRSYTDKVGEAFVPDAALCDIALRCGRVFDIDLYGLDIVQSDNRYYVVDMNKFGSYMGVPDASRLLADYLRTAARGAH